MLDLKNNLVYAVYKELDYATNFAPNGTMEDSGVVQYGEWENSGLIKPLKLQWVPRCDQCD